MSLDPSAPRPPGATGRSRATPWVLTEVLAERRAQDAKWGEQNHRDGTGHPEWAVERDEQRAYTDAAAREGNLSWHDVLREEVAEAFAETDEERLRTELLQVAAVAVAWVEAIDRRTAARAPATTTAPPTTPPSQETR